MSTNTNQDQEVDLGQIFNKVGELYEKFISKVFDGIFFLKRNIILVLIIIIFGIVLGYFTDENNKSYNNELIVTPNLGSVDYLYKKVELIEAKIKESDQKFFASIGIKDYKKIKKVEIEPVLDIYTFVNNNTAIATNAQNTQNFELVKLLSEESDINKVVKDELTSRNYPHHTIKIKSNGLMTDEKIVKPLMDYFNNSEYYRELQTVYIDNINVKMQKDQVVINQIDGLLNQFTTAANGPKTDKLVYYNDNTQLNDLINNKTALIAGLGLQRQLLLDLNKIIKTKSVTLNIIDSKGMNGKMKLILPFLFVLLFIAFKIMFHLYKKQMMKRSN
jgi:hypothetical protein